MNSFVRVDNSKYLISGGLEEFPSKSEVINKKENKAEFIERANYLLSVSTICANIALGSFIPFGFTFFPAICLWAEVAGQLKMNAEWPNYYCVHQLANTRNTATLFSIAATVTGLVFIISTITAIVTFFMHKYHIGEIKKDDLLRSTWESLNKPSCYLRND